MKSMMASVRGIIHPHGPSQFVVSNHARAVASSELRLLDSEWASRVTVDKQHVVFADLKHKTKGGLLVDIGVSPKELLLASLAASQTMTLRSCYKHALAMEAHQMESVTVVEAGAEAFVGPAEAFS